METNTKDGYYTNLSYATQHATGWRVTSAKTGVFLRTNDDHILARVADGCIWLYDRHNKAEIQIGLDYLADLGA